MKWYDEKWKNHIRIFQGRGKNGTIKQNGDDWKIYMKVKKKKTQKIGMKSQLKVTGFKLNFSTVYPRGFNRFLTCRRRSWRSFQLVLTGYLRGFCFCRRGINGEQRVLSMGFFNWKLIFCFMAIFDPSFLVPDNSYWCRTFTSKHGYQGLRGVSPQPQNGLRICKNGLFSVSQPK